MQLESELIEHFYVKVEGVDLPTKVMDDVIEITVDSNLHLPDMFTIHVADEDLDWLDQDIFPLGAKVEIAVVPEVISPSQVLIKGEITALEPDFQVGTRATLLVRGYDRSHRLQRGTHSQAHQQVTDSDLAKRIAKKAGLRANVDATEEIYDHVLQNNQTDMEFLRARAQRIGYDFFVEDETLYFKRPNPDRAPLELEWGHQLKQFSPRLTLVEQVNEVVVRGWDPKTRQVMTGQAQPAQDGAGAGWRATFQEARRVIVDRLLHSQAEADILAQTLCDELSQAYIEAVGECSGEPGLRAGQVVNLTALGQRLSGLYFVTTATHIYSGKAGYRTTFSVHGRRSETLYALIEQTAARKGTTTGPVIAIVTNNNDPKGWGRVKLKYPWLADEVESDWARVVSPGAGPGRGFFCLPEVNDEVLVAFEQGDIGRPYVLGGLWNGRDAPPACKDQVLERGKVRQRVFKSRGGHTLIFTEDAKASIVLKTAGGQTLILDDAKNEIVLESGGNLTLKSRADLNLEANGKMKLTAVQVNINNGALEVI